MSEEQGVGIADVAESGILKKCAFSVFFLVSNYLIAHATVKTNHNINVAGFPKYVQNNQSKTDTDDGWSTKHAGNVWNVKLLIKGWSLFSENELFLCKLFGSA